MGEVKQVKMYVEGSKEYCWEKGEELGLTGEALRMFRHALTEFEVVLEVDMETGESKPIKFAGKDVR